MSRPQIVVNVSPALPRRGADSETGVAFIVYAGATGSLTPVTCVNAAQATASGAPAAVATWVGDALTQGAPRVVLLRAAAVDATNVTQTEWTTALGLLTDEFGPGQVCIPGVSTAAAYAALLAHADVANRCALLDSALQPVASSLATSAIGLAAANGSQRATIVTWGRLTGPAGTTRDVPGSVLVAGLTARGDAIAGHANNAPIFDQGRGAGYVDGAVGVPKVFTTAELDTLHDAGVSVIRPIGGVVQLAGWSSLSTDDRFSQLNAGRMSMQLGVGVGAGVRQFLGRQIDGKGALFAELEGALRGYLQPLFESAALFGQFADEAYEVEVAAVNTAATIKAGELHAAVAVALTPHAEKVVIDVVTTTAQGV